MQEPKTISMDAGNGVENYVLIPKQQWEKEHLQKVADDKEIKLRPWAHEITGIKSYNTLIPLLNHYRKDLDINNGGCVYFPNKPGVPYKFVAGEFKDFVIRHKRVFTKAKI
ncbi:DUF771 domain-containing protein [Companilactobacillus nodensis]|nr:DUF771 domain-containing protein [Companilactobacillus nodensis]